MKSYERLPIATAVTCLHIDEASRADAVVSEGRRPAVLMPFHPCHDCIKVLPQVGVKTNRRAAAGQRFVAVWAIADQANQDGWVAVHWRVEQGPATVAAACICGDACQTGVAGGRWEAGANVSVGAGCCTKLCSLGLPLHV